MGTLTLDLREGFQGDQVVVRVDGREVANEADVSTDYTVGLASRISTTVGSGRAVVEVLCPNKSLTVRREIEVEGDGWVNIRLEDGDLKIDQTSGEEALY
jgi:hypothetical protein